MVFCLLIFKEELPIVRLALELEGEFNGNRIKK